MESSQQAGNDVTNEVKIKDLDLQVHLWNGKPSAAAELKTWVVVVGNWSLRLQRASAIHVD